MDYAIHVKISSPFLAISTSNSQDSNVQIVKLLPVGVRTNGADWYLLSIDFSRLFFDNLRDDLGVLLREPAKKRWNTHICFCTGRFRIFEGRLERLYDYDTRTLIAKRRQM